MNKRIEKKYFRNRIDKVDTEKVRQQMIESVSDDLAPMFDDFAFNNLLQEFDFEAISKIKNDERVFHSLFEELLAALETTVEKLDVKSL